MSVFRFETVSPKIWFEREGVRRGGKAHCKVWRVGVDGKRTPRDRGGRREEER